MPGLKPSLVSAEEQALLQTTRASAAAQFPAFAIEFSKIAARSNLLFPFLSPGVSLAELGTALDQRPVELVIPLADVAPPPNPTASPPPLQIGAAALQSIADRSWSRRYRWNAFQEIVKLAGVHDADRGELPALVQMYVKQNALQPYVDGRIRDHRLWVQMGIAADQVDFIAFISRYATQHQGAKTSIELLFLLDTLAKSSLDNLLTLGGTDPSADLRWTKKENATAFELMAAVHSYYRQQLQKMGLASTEHVGDYYRHVRLSILRHIINTTRHEYRSNDARFLIGAILWSKGQHAEALRAWREITRTIADDRYVASYTSLLPAIGLLVGPVDDREVDRILAREQAAWVSLSFHRLRQFGYRFDTF
jgi:hypothetical protein